MCEVVQNGAFVESGRDRKDPPTPPFFISMLVEKGGVRGSFLSRPLSTNGAFHTTSHMLGSLGSLAFPGARDNLSHLLHVVYAYGVLY